MPGQKHNNKIQEIKEYFESKNFRCGENVNVVRNKKNLIDGGVGKIDICCEQDNSIFCAEIESNAQKQALRNRRDLQEMERQARKRGIRFKGCQVGDDEPLSICFRKDSHG
ncbi:hypothetical protein ES703_24870 [subsurface metagenome]